MKTNEIPTVEEVVARGYTQEAAEKMVAEMKEQAAREEGAEKPSAEEVLETSEELQAQIEELSKKLAVAQSAEIAAEQVEMVEMPVCDCRVQVAKGHDVARFAVTPAEAMLLTAQFHKAVGGIPISGVKNIRKVKIDPIALKAGLINRYGAEKVNKLFPGAEPRYPKTFRAALATGTGASLPEAMLMEYQIHPDGNKA